MKFLLRARFFANREKLPNSFLFVSATTTLLVAAVCSILRAAIRE